MGFGEVIKDWLGYAGDWWGERLGNWSLKVLSNSLTKSLEDMEPGAIEGYSAGLQKAIDDPLVPEEIKVFLRKANTTGNPISVVSGALIMAIQSLGVLLAGSIPISNVVRYSQDSTILSARVDPLSVINAWRRDPATFGVFMEDLTEQGWSTERINLLKKITEFLPNADEQTLWLAREVFEPEMIRKYGLDDETPDYTNTDFEKIGVTQEQMVNKWRAHWQHASWIQVVEMLHRGLLTEEDVSDWFRLVEITPFWRQKLIDTAYTWPTRVDVRRWWDMRTIDEARLRELYEGMGYRGKNLDDYIAWTKVFTDFPSLMARWQKGWITLEDIEKHLLGLGIPQERVTQFIQEKVGPEEPERVEEGRNFTKSEIYKGVRAEVISVEQGVDLLMDLGHSLAEAEYLIDINVEVLTGSPESIEDFKRLTGKYRKAIGKEVVEMPEELKQAAAELVRITEEVKSLQDTLATEEAKVLDQEVIPAENDKRIKELQVAINRAIAERQRLQLAYNSQVAEFRQ